MITCEKCKTGYPNSQIETAQVLLKDMSRRHATLCRTCWDSTQPGEWVTLLGEDGTIEDVRRLYWPCDLCGSVYRFDGVKVLVHLTDALPRTEYMVCKECAARNRSLQPKPTKELVREAVLVEPKSEPSPTVVAQEAQIEPEPILNKASANPATQQNSCSGTSRDDHYHYGRGIQKASGT